VLRSTGGEPLNRGNDETHGPVGGTKKRRKKIAGKKEALPYGTELQERTAQKPPIIIPHHSLRLPAFHSIQQS